MNSKRMWFTGILVPMALMLLLHTLWLQFLMTWWESISLSLSASFLGLWALNRYYNPTKSREFAMLRILLLLELAVYLLYKFLKERGATRDFSQLPVPLLIWFAIVFLCWSTAQSSARPWLFRKNFHGMLKKKSGKPVKEQLRNLGYYQQKNLKLLKRLKNQMVLLLFLGVMLAGFILPSRDDTPLGLILSGFLAAMLLIAARFLVTRSIREDYLLGEGLETHGRDKRGEGIYYLLLLSFVSVAGYLASMGGALLSSNILKDAGWGIFLWFNSWAPTQNQHQQSDSIGGRRNLPPEQQNMLEMMEEGRSTPTTFMTEQFRRVLLIVLLSLFGLILLTFLIYPILKKRENKEGKKKEKKSSLSLRERIKLWFKEHFGKKSRQQVLKVEWDSKTNEIQKVSTAAKKMSKEDLKLKKGMEKNFYRLCRWGKKQKHPFQTGWSPQEYCLELANSFPRWKGEFVGLGKIFEKHFYSSHRLTPKEIDPIEPWLKSLEKRRNK